MIGAGVGGEFEGPADAFEAARNLFGGMAQQEVGSWQRMRGSREIGLNKAAIENIGAVQRLHPDLWCILEKVIPVCVINVPAHHPARRGRLAILRRPDPSARVRLLLCAHYAP